MLHNTELEFCQVIVSSVKRIVYMYILTCEIHSIHTQLAIN